MIEIIEYPRDISVPNWDKYRKCNHHKFTVANRKLGLISFKEHLNKKLSKELWDDLIYRIRPNTLWIIKQMEEVWTIGHLLSHVTIYIDDNDVVLDIFYQR